MKKDKPKHSKVCEDASFLYFPLSYQPNLNRFDISHTNSPLLEEFILTAPAGKYTPPNSKTSLAFAFRIQLRLSKNNDEAL